MDKIAMTLQEAKDKAAQENEWSDWNHIEYSDIEQHEKDQIYAHLLDRVAELYAKSCAKEAKEQAKQFASRESDKGNDNVIDWMARFAQSCSQEAFNRIEELEGALEDAINGLQWRIDNNPEMMDKSDYEKLDEWNNLLKLKKKK